MSAESLSQADLEELLALDAGDLASVAEVPAPRLAPMPPSSAPAKAATRAAPQGTKTTRATPQSTKTPPATPQSTKTTQATPQSTKTTQTAPQSTKTIQATPQSTKTTQATPQSTKATRAAQTHEHRAERAQPSSEASSAVPVEASETLDDEQAEAQALPSVSRQKSFIEENARNLNRETKLAILSVIMMEIGNSVVMETGNVVREVDIDLDAVARENVEVLGHIYNIVRTRLESLSQPLRYGEAGHTAAQ